jgi:predicted nucleic acid-binding protein
MKVILDASVAVKWVIPESDSPQALALRTDIGNQVHTASIRDTFPIEVAHALTRAERRGVLLQKDAIVKLMDVLSTPLDVHPSLPLLARAVEISSQARIGVYDCLYLALAEQESCIFVTADQRLAAIGHSAVRLLASFP